MSDLHFREIDLNSEPEAAAKFAALVESELGGTRHISTIRKTLDYDVGNAKVMGAFLRNELASVNAFMLMEFFRGTQKYIGYQSGFSATHGSHRGRGIWPKLLKFTEGYLADAGASFIFGFPNPVSHPLFVKKLGYQSTELYHFRANSLPIIHRLGYNADVEIPATHSESILEPNAAFNIAWKRRSLGEDVVVSFTIGESIVWGVVRAKEKYGIKFNVLDVGGLSLRSAGDLPKLLRVATKTVSARFIFISLNRRNVYFPLFKFRNNRHVPAIIKPLTDTFVPEKLNVNFFRGLSDVY